MIMERETITQYLNDRFTHVHEAGPIENEGHLYERWVCSDRPYGEQAIRRAVSVFARVKPDDGGLDITPGKLREMASVALKVYAGSEGKGVLSVGTEQPAAS